MNKKKIITLLIGVAVLLGILVFVVSLPDKETARKDAGSVAPGSEQVIEELPIYTAGYESLVGITLYSEDEIYVFSKNGTLWNCDSHPNETFNMSRIGALATRLTGIKYKEVLSADSVKPQDCGIDIEKPAISFESDLGVVFLYKGNATATSDGYYLMTSLSSDVYIITPQTYNSVFEPISEYKDVSIHHIDYEKITAIEFKNEICSFSLRLESADMNSGVPYEWRMISPIELMARDDKIKEMLIKPVTSISEKMYVSDKGDFENYGFGDKSNYIVYTDSNGESQTVYFSSDVGGKCYMSIDDSAYIYEAGDASQTYSKVGLIDIASRYIYINMQENIKEVVVEEKGNKYTIDFPDSSDISVNGNKLTDGDECNEVFYAVCSLLADDISTEPLGQADITITYKLKDGKTVVASFAPKDARYWNVAIDGKPTYAILKSKIDSTIQTLDKYAK